MNAMRNVCAQSVWLTEIGRQEVTVKASGAKEKIGSKLSEQVQHYDCLYLEKRSESCRRNTTFNKHLKT